MNGTKAAEMAMMSRLEAAAAVGLRPPETGAPTTQFG